MTLVNNGLTYDFYLEYFKELSKCKTISDAQRYGMDNDIDTIRCIDLWLVLKEDGELDMLSTDCMSKGLVVKFEDFGKVEYGKVKSWNETGAWVVYKCGGDWDNFENYTGAHTEYKYLSISTPNNLM